jgi:integrase/recombinase XerD
MQATSPRFRAERAVSPLDRSELWVVLDPDLVVHPEASDFLRALYGADRSPHTIRVYAGRLAFFLGWCATQGVDWSSVSIPTLARFKHVLEATPLHTGKLRSASTVNATLTAVCEFLRFCARTGVIDQAVADRLSEPRFLRFPPPGFDPGELGQFRMVRARAIKARTETTFPEAFTPDQADAVLGACRRPREIFLATLLRDSGLRIGEALGLHRCDMHLLPDSRTLGCAVLGPHLHVCHRANPNGALAKSRFPRSVPASQAVLDAYADYQFERDDILGHDDNDMVFVNLYHQPRGMPMTYPAAKGFFDRLARECNFPVRPHMFRHFAATNWVRAGVDIDVIQRLLGHASLASVTVYLHARDEDKRRAVEVVAAGGRYR